MTGKNRDKPTVSAYRNGADYSDWVRDYSNTPPTPKRARFNVWSAADALEAQPEIEWIVERLFSAGSVSSVFGDGGSKKTLSMLDLSVCTATGVNWLGLAVMKCPVLYMDEEAGRSKILRRLNMCLRGHGVEGAALDIHGSSLSLLNICNPQDINELRMLIQQFGARLVIIDSWISSAQGIENENDAVKVQAVYRQLRALADELQVAIVIIDHTNKTNGYRGSTAKKGGVDCMLGVTSANGSANIAFHIEKARDTEPFNFAALAHFSDGDSFYLTAQEGPSGSTLVESKWDAPVLNFLGENGESTIRRIAAALNGLTESAARNVLGKLSKENKVVRANDGGRGTVAIYKLL